MQQNADDPPPSRIPWPPILIVATLIAGRGLDLAAGGALELPAAVSSLGVALIVLALAGDAWCARTLWRRGTTILPHRAVSSLATDGPYRFSRNPIYVSHVALTFGVGLLLRSGGVALLIPLLVFALVKLAIEPEERHLLRKFGDEFSAYARRVRRWI
jgi:protein-S-isoprenylcysteine O-methyltransferase Ste14